MKFVNDRVEMARTVAMNWKLPMARNGHRNGVGLLAGDISGPRQALGLFDLDLVGRGDGDGKRRPVVP